MITILIYLTTNWPQAAAIRSHTAWAMNDLVILLPSKNNPKEIGNFS